MGIIAETLALMVRMKGKEYPDGAIGNSAVIVRIGLFAPFPKHKYYAPDTSVDCHKE